MALPGMIAAPVASSPSLDGRTISSGLLSAPSPNSVGNHHVKILHHLPCAALAFAAATGAVATRALLRRKRSARSIAVARARHVVCRAAAEPAVDTLTETCPRPGKILLQVRGGRIRREPLEPEATAGKGETKEEKPLFAPESDGKAVLDILTGSPLNLALLAIPFGLVSEAQGWGDVATFSFNFIAIIPLAKILGEATEELVFSVGPAVGGLLNATLGNAVEMIIAVYALQDGLIDVVKGSLVGSIISNLLLVMGMCFFFGGLKYKRQTFSAGGARTLYSLLLLAVLALLLPTVASLTGQATAGQEVLISRGAAVVLGSLYVLFLYFQLETHKDEFTLDNFEASGAVGGAPRSEPWPLKEGETAPEIEDLEEEEQKLSLGAALSVLTATTLLVAACSEGLTGSVEGLTKTLGISKLFVGVILLPIVGNAAEHLTAVTVATKDKMDLSLGVALGSSVQIALFVVPFTVLAGAYIGAPMDLNFQALPTVVMLLTVLIVGSTINDGESNWLEGIMLIGAYVLIAVVLWFI